MSKGTTTDKAFRRAAAGYELFGKVLEPFTALRQAAASTMGLRFGMVDPGDVFEVTRETIIKRKVHRQALSFYNQLFADVVMVLWLCSVPTSRVLRALRKVEEAKEDAFKWADQHTMRITSDNYFDGATVFLKIMQDLINVTVIPEPDEQTEEPGDEGND